MQQANPKLYRQSTVRTAHGISLCIIVVNHTFLLVFRFILHHCREDVWCQRMGIYFLIVYCSCTQSWTVLFMIVCCHSGSSSSIGCQQHDQFIWTVCRLQCYKWFLQLVFLQFLVFCMRVYLTMGSASERPSHSTLVSGRRKNKIHWVAVLSVDRQ